MLGFRAQRLFEVVKGLGFVFFFLFLSFSHRFLAFSGLRAFQGLSAAFCSSRNILSTHRCHGNPQLRPSHGGVDKGEQAHGEKKVGFVSVPLAPPACHWKQCNIGDAAVRARTSVSSVISCIEYFSRSGARQMSR